MTSWRRLLQGLGILTANKARGNFAIGENVTQIYLQGNDNLLGVTATEPSLPFAPLHDAFEGTEPDIASLLRWRYRLVETLYGREQEIDDIKAWANSDRKDILIRLVEGEGGSGKTRLGAEAAESLRKEGWSAGFLARSGSLIHPAGKKGLFLIVDYPEEQPERIKALIDSIRSSPQPGYRLRFLLLSRRSYEDWGETFGPIRDLVGRQAIAHLGSLPEEQAKHLIAEASERLAKQLGRNAGELRGVDEWLVANNDNRLSLYATAAAAHHVLAPEDTFGLAAPDIVADLVSRELARVTEASRAAELGEHALPRLLALATVAGKLISEAVARLAKPEQQIFDCPENLAIDRLRGLPWWDRGDESLPALTPDILAAIFTSRVLNERPKMAPQWLWAVLEGGIGSDFAARVGRVIHDIDRMEREPSDLPVWLEQIVIQEPQASWIFADLTLDQWLSHRLASLSGTAGTMMADWTGNDELKASILNNVSVDLAGAGRHTEALQASRHSVEIRERLAAEDSARFDPDLASSLNNLSNRLSETGDDASALEAAQRAVDISERLALSDPARFEPVLSKSLCNLANTLRAVGDNARALDAAQRAVDIQERLATDNPGHFEPGLASLLGNLANHLSNAGDDARALEAGQRAVEIHERLAAANPGHFEPILADTLQNLSILLHRKGEFATALRTAERTVEIYQRLVAANQTRFDPDLAASLCNLANRLSASGDNVRALGVAGGAIVIYERLVAANPARFERDLAASLINRAIIAESVGKSKVSSANARRALLIWRRLAQAAPAAYLPQLLKTLRDCARIFATAGLQQETNAAHAELAELMGAIERAKDISKE